MAPLPAREWQEIVNELSKIFRNIPRLQMHHTKLTMPCVEELPEKTLTEKESYGLEIHRTDIQETFDVRRDSQTTHGKLKGLDQTDLRRLTIKTTKQKIGDDPREYF